jgi:5-methylcytosine-specific restriction enzyme subunit McrC
MSALPSHITCFEYDFIPIEVTDRQRRSLDRLKQQVGQPVFVRGFNTKNQAGLKATKFVGVFQLDDVTIQVLPKIYHAEHRKAEEATANLLFLLKYAADLPLPTDLVALQNQRSDFLEVLIGVFATHLRSQWQQGAFRTYRSVEDVLPVLKGQWRLTAQLRRPAQPHQFAVTYDEFTADNSLNRILRYVVERLWHLTRDSQNRRILGDLKLWMDEVTLLPSVTLAETLALPITRLNQRFEPLLNLARLFLSQHSVSLTGGDCRTYGFTFDMNRLFEQFVTNLLKRRRDAWPEVLQDCEIRSQVQGRYLATRSDGSNVFQLKPDLAFVSNGDYRLIIDTKYKRLNQADRKLGVSQADMYQMCAYAQRFRCDRILLLYPQTSEISQPIREFFRVPGTEVEIQVATLNLQRNLQQRSQQEQLFIELQWILGANYEYAN